MISLQKRQTTGFTLLEISVVIIILGVMASLAFPRFTATFERVRAAEGVQILTALLGSQKVYEMENAAYTATLADLDVTIPAAANFGVPTVATADPIASITRTGGYRLEINIDGSIDCCDNGTPTCEQAGYTGAACP